MYRYYVPKRKPSAFWMLDDTVPFQEYSGIPTVAGKKTGSGDPLTSAPLVSGAAYSSVFDQSRIGQFASPFYKQGLEARPFALEAWVAPLSRTYGNQAQAYRENRALNPAGGSTTAAEYGTRWGWIGSWVSGAADNPTQRLTYNRQTSPSLQTAVTGRGIDLYCNMDSAPPTTGNALLQPVVAGETITASMFIRFSSTTQVHFPWRIHDGAGNWFNSIQNGATINMPANTWVRVSRTFTADSTGFLSLGVRTVGSPMDWPAASTMDIAGLLIEKAPSVLPYFDGSSVGCEWSGTTNFSRSRTRADVSRINFNQNPSGEAGTVVPWTANAGVTITRDTTEKLFGAASIKIVSTSAASAYYAASVSQTVYAGQKVTMTAWVKGTAGQTGKIFDRRSTAAVGTWISEDNFRSTFTFTGSWQRVVLSFIQPVDARIGMMINTTVANTYWMDGTTLELDVVTPADYFDGDSLGAGWAGTQYTSASLMYVSNSDQQILSHDGVFDGLSINGNVVRFGTSYLTSGNAYCDYDLQGAKSAHVVGLHTADKNELWVNGVQVSSVVITDAQKADRYIATDGNLYSGYTVSSQDVAMNGVALYPSLSGEQINQNYLAGIDVLPQARVAPQFSGLPFNLDAGKGSVFINESWVNKANFETGIKNNVEIGPEEIVPSFVSGVSVAGTWTCGVPLDAMGDTSIYGVMVAWSGVGITVDTSLNGVTWAPAKNGELVPAITPGFNPTDDDLQIRVSFAGGKVDDTAYLESLQVIGFRDAVVNSPAARTVTATYPAVLREDYEPFLYRDDNGINLHGGTLTIGPDTTLDPEVARTLELWIKPLSGTPTISVGGTKYRNGFADSTLPIGEWSLIHYVAAADVTTDITITGDCIVGQATLYPTALTATQVEFIWDSYTGGAAIRFTETNVIGLAESATPAAIYAKDWSIDAGG